MAGEIIRLGDSTSHGGTVIEGSMTDICHGKPIAYVGHKVHCPKCKGDFPIIEGVMTTTFYGKGVAIAGMKTSCGAALVASQFTDTVEYAGGSSAGAGQSASMDLVKHMATVPAISEKNPIAARNGDDKEKKITRIFWTYGADQHPVDGISRHHVDLNLHVESVNYAPGENALIVVANEDGSELFSGSPTLELQAIIGSDGTSKFMNVFKGRTPQIGRIG